ncbi:hypothetical protein ABW21_db0207326 [Orbilia brochopaga]|nr:hypothetical protein ABW21_db0207326 [Drechslerella brochopaga]
MAEGRRSLRFDDYYVGWVSPLAVPEQVAAQSVFDEIHDDASGLGTTVNDNNVYTLGRIGRVNIVLAGLPDGEQGIGAAARVAKDMLRTYYNIKVILLVGTGEGVPGFKVEGVDGDIRLGDVVVSTPSKDSNAVIQFDYGKSMQGGEFKVSNWSFDKPPPAARAAIAKLKVTYACEGNNIAEKIEEITKGDSSLATYAHPFDEGRAFKRSYTHQNYDQRCDICCSFDEANLLPLEGRDDPSAVVVHYGTIGSANQVVNDSILRDIWAKEKNIICFETEAAGEELSFLVPSMRTPWQPYAALAAAVYAKQLVLSMNWQAMRRIDPISSTIAHFTQSQYTSKTSGQNIQERRVILEPLTPIDYDFQKTEDRNTLKTD